MSESRVEAVLKAKPLERGKVEAGAYKIYGSNETFNIHAWLHFRNIFILFREETVAGIYSVPGGSGWRQELGRLFSDLPGAKR